MYPVLFRIGSFEITSFGVMLAVAAVASLRIFRRELRRSGLPAATTDAALYGLFGGIVGAKIVWAIEHSSTAPILSLIFARGGLSWYGGLLGGLVVGIGVLVSRRLPLVAILSAATPAFAMGHALGRIGCFLVGDDYGIPSQLPWAVAFPDGMPPTTVPVHPTQIYEAIGLFVLGVLLIRWRKARLPGRLVLGRYLILAGALRFAIEWIRVYDPIVFGLAVAHIFSLLMMFAGLAVIAFTASSSRQEPPFAVA
jgi:phosphatidylglycerol---prolipoprotein diacylglyceryl transferase